MKILAFELSNFSSSLAVVSDGEVLAFEKSDVFRGQDVTLFSKIEALLKEANVSFDQIDRLATTTGPGSFTGIRVGLATAQGLSLSLKKPAVGIGSFDWVSQFYRKKYTGSKELLIVLESMREELYVKDADAVALPLSPQEIAERFDPENYIAVGGGAKHLEGTDFDVLSDMPNAGDLAHQAMLIPDNQLGEFLCLPTYLRPADTSISTKKI